MSFQGDVGGIGLAELLQGLARGRKEGLLTLTARQGLRSVLGFEDGQVFLLPEADEDVEAWRSRVRGAWADQPDFRVDYLRMSEVARAARLESVYALLDGEGVHFRFEPGPLPEHPVADTDGEGGVHCQGIPVEFLLLEYARLSDHLELAPDSRHLPSELVPCLLDGTASDNSTQKFFAACTGTATLAEIADRLGWPLRQAKLAAWNAFQHGNLRAADPREMLALALIELSRRNLARAAARLDAWCRDGRPGPVDPAEAEALSNEWIAGRLPGALRGMEPRRVRTLLRRLDHALANPSTSAVHWIEAYRSHRADQTIRLHHLIAEYRDGNDPERPGVRELLDLARELRDAGTPWRAAPLLVVAAMCQPDGLAAQLEIGQGLVAAGRVEEGGPWIVAAARTLLEQDNADRAVVPLRALLARDPGNRECRQLLSRARRSSTHVRKLRRHLLVGLAVAALVSVGGMVKVHADRDFQRRLEEVRHLLDEPAVALARLDSSFPAVDNPDVAALRQEIHERQLADEEESRSEWNERYHEAQMECTVGDPIEGLRLALALPEPPHLELIDEPWPLKRDLFTGLVDHIGEALDALGPPVEGAPQQVRREREIRQQVTDVQAAIADAEVTLDVAQFLEALDALEAKCSARDETRKRLVDQRIRGENLERQDRLLALARAHAKNGDFARSLSNYDELLKTDPDGKTHEVLAAEIGEVREKQDAVKRARQLASEGQHDAAFTVLKESLDEPERFLLPWSVASYPSGVRVRLQDGSTRTTPFDIETTFGEHLSMTFQLEGFDDLELAVDRPANRFLHLTRTSERSWRAEGRVDAIPVAVGEDHIVVDRKGRLARIGPAGAVRWETHVRSLSGIARAPVFLPKRPGHLLLVTEDGSAWIIDAKDGELEGPWDLGSPPLFGPGQHIGHVRVQLQDGRVALWQDRLKPSLATDEPRGASRTGEEGSGRYGTDSGMQVTRRRVDGEGSFECNWNNWVVEATPEALIVHKGDRSKGYSVVPKGEWEYLAWEAPFARAPEGRLWLSDGFGVRAFVPPPSR